MPNILDQQVDPNYGLLGAPQQGMLGMPLAMLGMGLLQAGAPSTDPGGLQRGIGQGVTGFYRGLQAQQQQALQSQEMALRQAQFQAAQDKLNREQQQQWATAQAFREAQAGNPQAAEALMAGDPRYQQAAIEARFAVPKTPTMKRAMDPRSGRVIYASDAEIAREGYVPPPPTPAAEVNINQKQEGKEAEIVGAGYGKMFLDLQVQGRSARDQNARLDQLDSLLDKVETGAGAEALLGLKRWGQRLGFDVGDDLGPAEAAQALSNEFALQLRNPAGGAGMPGAMSDRDREFLQSMVVGLSQTREGRKQLIAMRKKINQRSIEVARLARKYRQENGQLNEGFYDLLDQEFANNPANDLFGSERGQFVEARTSTAGPERYDPNMSTPELLDYLNIPHDLRNQ